MDNQPLSNRTKFAIAMVVLVIIATIGMRVYRYFYPLTIDSIFVEDMIDYDQVESELFNDTSTEENVNNTETLSAEAITTISPERTDIPAIERLGTLTLTPGKDVEAVTFQDRYVVTLNRDNKLFLQTYSSTWELKSVNEEPIDTIAAVQRQLVADDENVYVFSLRKSDAGYQLDVMQFDSALNLESTFILFTEQPTVSKFTALVNDKKIYVYEQNSSAIGKFLSYDNKGAVLTERSITNYDTPIAITADPIGSLILVTYSISTLQFIKLNTLGEEQNHFSINLEDEGYTPHDFLRWQDYIMVIGSVNAVNSNYSQLLVWSQNLTTQYPSIHFNKNLLSPNMITGENGTFLVYVEAETTSANATEVTTYTIKVDQLAGSAELLDSSLQEPSI